MTSDNTSIFVNRAVGGEAEGIEWIVERFQPLVRAQVRIRLRGRGTSQDVEDLANDVWLVTLSNLSRLEAREGRMAPVLVRYLGTTVLRTCNNFLRRSARLGPRGAGRTSDEDGEDRPRGVSILPAETIGVLTRVARKDQGLLAQGYLDGLAPDKRDVLVLRIMEQRSNQEIAELLELQPNTVAVRYKRALEELRRVLPSEVLEDLQAI
jgi:RNA polymerase sigma factor (sigma-70 family)